MALPDFSMRQLLEAGVHFGHQTHRWNPKMGKYIFGARNNIHIIDLAETVPLLHQALVTVRDIVANRGRVLFVGTKRQASEPIALAAKSCAQYYINHRWLGGTLTNWTTISKSIARLCHLDEVLGGESHGMTKKELLKLTRERDRLERALGGIKDMGGVPDIIFVIDTNKESIAIKEARKLGIPIVAIIDTNCDPDQITYPIPGNDDAGRAVNLYCDLIARAVIDGISASAASDGVDLGEAVEVVEAAIEPATEEAPVVEEAAAAPAVETVAAETEAAAPVDGYKGLSEPNGEADDLKKISGVGPVLEEKLNKLGIYHYEQIANFSVTDISAIDEELNFKGRIERDDWLDQASKLMKG
jgi:small subunit ribosomal protein S2